MCQILAKYCIKIFLNHDTDHVHGSIKLEKLGVKNGNNIRAKGTDR